MECGAEEAAHSFRFSRRRWRRRTDGGREGDGDLHATAAAARCRPTLPDRPSYINSLTRTRSPPKAQVSSSVSSTVPPETDREREGGRRAASIGRLSLVRKPMPLASNAPPPSPPTLTSAPPSNPRTSHGRFRVGSVYTLQLQCSAHFFSTAVYK